MDISNHEKLREAASILQKAAMTTGVEITIDHEITVFWKNDVNFKPKRKELGLCLEAISTLNAMRKDDA